MHFVKEQLAEARSSAEANKSSEGDVQELNSKLGSLTKQLSQQQEAQEQQVAEVRP